MSSNGTYDQGDVKIPDQNTLQKSREILDELRRRAGERFRPEIEFDYIDRLLKVSERIDSRQIVAELV